MNKVMLVITVAVMAFIGCLYLLERDEVSLARAAVTSAAGSTAVTLSQKSEPERNTDADADGLFKSALPNTVNLDEVAVKQSVQPVSPGRFRQSVKVFARARTTMSEFFNMPGAEIEFVADHDFERRQ